MSVAGYKNSLSGFDQSDDQVSDRISFTSPRRSPNVCQRGATSLFGNPSWLAVEIYQSRCRAERRKSKLGSSRVKSRHGQRTYKHRVLRCLVQNLCELTKQRRIINDERCAMNTTVRTAAGRLPSHNRPAILQSMIRSRTCRPETTTFVIAANHTSVPTAVSGCTPNANNRMGVIRAPPPTPVRPTTKPVAAPAVTLTMSISGQARAHNLGTFVFRLLQRRQAHLWCLGPFIGRVETCEIG